MNKQHENYRELIWMLAKTDFKLRYHGSVLGYLWALLKPLLMFAILNFVFTSIFFTKGVDGNEYYSLGLLTGILMFTFFAEGTAAGMASLVNKCQLVTKVYVPRWAVIVSATINSALVYVMNLSVVVAFFLFKGLVPSFSAMLLFLLFSVSLYIIILSFSLLTAPMYVKFRDLSMIWEVVSQMLFYATPVFYPIQMLPQGLQPAFLANPVAFIVHFSKESLLNNHFAHAWQYGMFFSIVITGFVVGVFVYQKLIPRVAEEI